MILRGPAHSGNLRRNPIFILGFLVFFAFAAYKTADYIIAGDMAGLSLIVLAFVGCAFMVAMLNSWHNSLYFFLTWLLFEDFARKFLGSTIVSVAALPWGAPWRQCEVIRVLQTVQRAALGTALALTLLFFIFPEALMARLAFYSKTLPPSSSASELQFPAWDYPIRNFLGAFGYERWPYGYGIGTTDLGTQYVAAIFHTKPTVTGVESGFGALVIEMGIGGLILWFVMSGGVLFSYRRVVKSLRGSPWFPIALMIFWYAFLLLIPITFSGIQPYEAFVVNAFLWLLLGILFRLPNLAISAQFAAVQPTPPMNRRWMR